MNDMTARGRRGDMITIDLVDLGSWIIRRYPWLILGLLLGLLAAAGFCGYKSVKTRNLTAERYDEAVAAAAETLTDAEREEAEGVYRQICAYDSALENQQAMNEDSFALRMDPEEAVGTTLYYLITTDLGNVGSVYDTSVLTEEDYDKLASILGTTPAYVSEAVTFGGVNVTDDTEEYDLERTERFAGSVSKDYRMIQKITILAPGEKACDEIMQIVEDAMQRRTSELTAAGVTIRIQRLHDAYVPDAREQVIAKQKQRMDTLTGIYNNRNSYNNNIVDKISGEEKTYIEALRARDESHEALQGKIRWARNLVLGAVGGLFLACVVLAAVYVLSGRIHTAGELTEMLRAPLLGVYRPGEDPALSAQELTGQAAAGGPAGICLAVDPGTPEAGELADALMKKTAEPLSVTVGGLGQDADSMAKLLAADGVVILAVLQKTKRRELGALADLCARNKRPVIGVLALKAPSNHKKK